MTETIPAREGAPTTPMSLEDLVAADPQFHDEGTYVTSYRLSEDVLRFLDDHLRPGMRTLETGEGVSTVLFAMRGAEHVCVSPAGPALQKIRDFCGEHGVSLENVDMDQRLSQFALPARVLGDLDVVLVDGGHGFPIPFVDWLYAGGALKPGGLLIVDDVHLWTGHVLQEFLGADPDWELVADFSPRSVIYRRLNDNPLGNEWTTQPYVASWSPPAPPGRLDRVARLARERRFGTIASKTLAFVARRVTRGSR